MPTYTIRLAGARTLDGRLSGRVLGDLLHALAHGSAGALRLRVEGRSATRGDRVPGWVERGTEFTLVDQQLTGEEPTLVLQAPQLAEALPERFAQADLFSAVDPTHSALTLLAASLGDAAAHREDSDAFDADLLGVFRRDLGRLFRGDRLESFVLRNGAPEAPALHVGVDALRAVQVLRARTPLPRRVRLAGRMDEARLTRASFVLALEDGARVRGVLVESAAAGLKPLFGELVVIEGMAQFRPSGRLLRVDVERLAPAVATDLRIFSTEPAPLDARLDRRALRRAQTTSTGLAAVFGQWPGDESDEEIERYLRDVS